MAKEKSATKVEGKATRSGPIDKKKREKKDPSAPKRGLSAYMFFSQENREKVKADNPDASFGQLGKLLGEKWKSLSDSEKQPYLDKAKADKERYEKEKAEAN